MKRMTGSPSRSVLVLAAVLLLVSCGGGESHVPNDDRTALPVEVGVAETNQWSTGIEVTAGLTPIQRATPGTVLMGRVAAVPVQEGDAVARGDLLARIEDREVAARLAQAEANVAAARAMERNAELMLQRMQRLHTRDAASQRDLDDATAGFEAAQAQRVAAEEAVKAARVHVGYAEIRAPFAGRVVRKHIDVGDMAAPGMPLLTVEDTSRVKVEAQVAESLFGELRVGQLVEVEVRGESREGRLSEIVPAADPHSRTFTIRVLLDNADGRLRSGGFARLRLGRGSESRIALPDSAIVRQGPLTGIFVIDTDETGSSRARLRYVTLGREGDGLFEVLTGIAAGERYVVRPGRDLEDGRRVEVRG